MAEEEQKLEKKKTDKNVCCHFCRISQNRNRRILGYAICNGCRKSYCRRCLEKYLDEDFEALAADESKAWQCLCCKLQCCCCFQLCTKDHRHCFTYRRTQQRHISVAPKWTKRKKGEEAKDDDDEPSPQRAKRKYTKRKQDDPLKTKRLNVNTNGEEMEDYNPSDDSGEGVTSEDDSVNEEEEEATGNLLGFVGSFKKEKSGQIRLDALPQNVTPEELKLLTEQAALQDERGDGESPTSKKKKDSKKEPRKGRKGKKDEENTFPFPHGFPPPLLPFGAPYNPMGLMRPFDSRLAPPLMLPIPPLPPYPMPPQGYYPLAMHPGPSAQQQQLLFMQQQQQQQMMMNHFPPGFNPQAPFLFPPSLPTGFPYPGPLPGGKVPAQEGMEGAASDLASLPNVGAEQQEEPAYAEVKEEPSNGMIEEKAADNGVVEAEITTGLAITNETNGANNTFNAYPASATTNNNSNNSNNNSENKIF